MTTATAPRPPIVNDSTPVILKPMNAFAVTSLVGGVLGFTFIGPIVAVVFGHLALKQIGEGDRQRGRGLAIAGLVLGYVSVVANIGSMVVIAVLAAIAVGAINV
jgi:hypothetical protein